MKMSTSQLSKDKRQELEQSVQNLVAKFSVDSNLLKRTTAASPLLIGGIRELDLTKLDMKTVEKYLLAHPVVPRGIEIKANRIISRGCIISGDNEEYKTYCEMMYNNSGGLINIKRWIEDAYGFGNGFRKLVTNKNNTEILKVIPEHPVYFGYLKEKKSFDGKDMWRIIINESTQEPQAYSQYRYVSSELEMVGNSIPIESVAHLKFDTWGDEVEGVSLIQYLALDIKYLLNMEQAGAESQVLFGNPKYKFKTNLTQTKDIKEYAKTVAGIRERDAVILTEGGDCEMLIPGTTDFPRNHELFLTLLAIKLGIPKPLLTMDGTSTNKATIDEQKKDMYEDNLSDENIICRTIKEQWFEPACKLKYGKAYDENKVPDFRFGMRPDDEDALTNRMLRRARAHSFIVKTVESLRDMGKDNLAEKLLKQLELDYTQKSEKRNI